MKCEHNGKWYDAIIEAQFGDGTFKIKFQGCADTERVGRDRIAGLPEQVQNSLRSHPSTIRTPPISCSKEFAKQKSRDAG